MISSHSALLVIALCIAGVLTSCPTGWLSYNDHCFYPNNNNQSYANAAATCASVSVPSNYAPPTVWTGDDTQEVSYVLAYYNLIDTWVAPIAAEDPDQCFEISDPSAPARPSGCVIHRVSICQTQQVANTTSTNWNYDPCTGVSLKLINMTKYNI
jgi:hypothetical protein